MSASEPSLVSPLADPSSPPGLPAGDSFLVPRASAGDTTAFAALFHRHYPAIHAFAYRLALCPAAADDITQDTFVRAARSLPSFRGEASFKNWLYSIATNVARDHHRDRARSARLDQQLVGLALDPATEARDHAATDNAHAAVRDALSRLAPEQREAIALVYYECLSHAEAARVLACAESTVSWRVFRAKLRLKKLLRANVAPRSGDAASIRHE